MISKKPSKIGPRNIIPIIIDQFKQPAFEWEGVISISSENEYELVL